MSRLEILPLVITRLVVQLSTATLEDVLYLHTVSKQFRKNLHHYSMVSHVHVELTDFLSAYYLGPLALGVHSVSMQHVPRLESLACLPALRVLDLSHGTFKSDLAPVALLNNLRTLNLSGCDKITHIASLPASLRVLHAWGCRSLVQLPDHPDLLELDIVQCFLLKALPSLPSLTSLDAEYVHHGSYPDTLNTLKLNEFGCADFLLPLKHLVSLDLNFPVGDHDVAAMAGLHNLKTLALCGHITDANLKSVESLSGLQNFSLHSNHFTDDNMLSIAKLRGLTSLRLNTGYSMLVTHAGFAALDLPTLTHLQLVSCYNLNDLRCLSQLANLESLTINASYLLGDLTPLSTFQKLHTLSFMYCDSLTSLRGVNQIPSLTELDVGRCWDLTKNGLFELLPCKLCKLSLNAHAHAQLGDSVDELHQQLKLRNPSVKLNF